MEEKKYTLDSDEVFVDVDIVKKRSWSNKEIICKNVYISPTGTCVVTLCYDKIEITYNDGMNKSFEFDEYNLIEAGGSISISDYTHKPVFLIWINDPIDKKNIYLYLSKEADLIKCLQFINYCNQCRISDMKTYFIKYEKIAGKEIEDVNFYNLITEYLLKMLDYNQYRNNFSKNAFQSSSLYREFSYECLTSSDPYGFYRKDKCTIFNKVNTYEIRQPFHNRFTSSYNTQFIEIIQQKYKLNETEANIFAYFLLTKSLIKLLSQNCVLASVISDDINIKEYSVEDIVEHYLYTYGENNSTSDHLQFLICYIYYNVGYSKSICELIDTVYRIKEAYLTKMRVASASGNSLSPNKLTITITENELRQTATAELIKENQKKNYLNTIYKQSENILTDEVIAAASNLVDLISPQVLLDINKYSLLRYIILKETKLDEIYDYYSMYFSRRNNVPTVSPQTKEYLLNFSKILCNRYGIIKELSAEIAWCVFNYSLINKYAQIWKSKCTIGEIGTMSIEEYVSKCVEDDLLSSNDPDAISTLAYYLCYINNNFYGISEPNNHSYSELVNYIKTAESQKKEDILEQRLFGSSSKTGKMKIIYTIDDIDLLDGYEFENIVARIFSNMGYNAQVTKSSGDQGIDVIAEKNGIKYGIQAKCYSSTVGNSAIQEAVAGKNYYNVDKVLVVTNSRFTPAAIKLAQSNGVILWDRTILTEKLIYIN